MKIKKLPENWPFVTNQQQELGLIKMHAHSRISVSIFKSCCKKLVDENFVSIGQAKKVVRRFLKLRN